jgi:hypothetical protein
MKAAGWLTALIERARTCGVDNEGIAAALEGSIVFRPVTIARDERDRLVGTMADGDITLDDLFNSSDADRRTR